MVFLYKVTFYFEIKLLSEATSKYKIQVKICNARPNVCATAL